MSPFVWGLPVALEIALQGQRLQNAGLPKYFQIISNGTVGLKTVVTASWRHTWCTEWPLAHLCGVPVPQLQPRLHLPVYQNAADSTEALADGHSDVAIGTK